MKTMLVCLLLFAVICAPNSTNQSATAAPGVDGKTYQPDEIKNTSAETFLERMQNPEPGYWQFAAMNALALKAKEADAGTRKSILSLVIAAMKDKSRTEYQRFQCCHVISGSGDEQGVPDLVEVLLKEESETLRTVAAEVLGQLTTSKAVHDALLQASREEKVPAVREAINKALSKMSPVSDSTAIAARTSVELAPSGPPTPPPGPKRPVAKPLSWPFQGDYKAQNVFNNYQRSPDAYIHCGLDFIHPAGTPVKAVGPGYVAAIWSREPHTHDYFIVSPKKGGNRGWCYTHMDPKTFTFKEGDVIREGQLLGNLVDFYVNGQKGMDHLHLHYVTFSKDDNGNINLHSVMDPLYFFDWKDTEAPTFQPLRFASEDATQQFQADASGVVTVNGKVDILAAITDIAFPGHDSLFGVPVVMLSISDGKHTLQKLVLDQRGDVGDEKQVKPLYLTYDEIMATYKPGSFPRFQVLRVTKTDGDGKINPQDETQHWDTTAIDSTGKPVWPDGKYSVNVYAWDIAGNKGSVGAMVEVKNGPGAD